MPLKHALAAVRVMEAAENYSLADVSGLAAGGSPPRNGETYYYDDETFWREALDGELAGTDGYVRVPTAVALSEWVARIPGLYWTHGSEALRSFAPDAVERSAEDEVAHDLGGVTLRPFGKSQVVSGGIGTLKLPPDVHGFRLCTFTTSANASTGVPVLVAPEVWSHHHLREGSVVEPGLLLEWRAMPVEWASRFRSTKGIPRRCLVLDDADALAVDRKARAPIQVHPFSIMRYAAGNTELFDFVYATRNTADHRHRDSVIAFFEDYRRREGRHGEYLVSADVTDPMWDSVYESPEDVRRDRGIDGSHYVLMERRLEERLQGHSTTKDLIQALCSLPSANDLQRLADLLDIPAASWGGGSLRDQSTRLVAGLPRDKLAPFVEALAIEYPGVLGSST